eukprot:CAMPEP_0183337590 /NCGR_PEP_ID=MMETSP0164_2-20130417/5172_1 /TAXON_ID=221442 /ORGANISM="Coccolithus pelagicus ssp braarudi, Strain PLY182g" /LENGTH=289 /DNA_ID=CAMNT_0025507297 /DNA_START=16 /DNA_END=882 /DNA_ORIENTATION=-
MEAELRNMLAGFDASVISTLAKNDVRSIDDFKLLSAEDLKELGFTLGVRNRLLEIRASQATLVSRVAAAATGLGGSMRSLLGSVSEIDAPADLRLFKQVIDYGGQDVTCKATRDQLYQCWDTNDNGFLSLAEVDQGIKVTLIGELKDRKEGERIWKRFRRSYIRAFVDAADAAPQRAGHGHTAVGGKRRVVNDDDYVTRREFRLLINYLSIYATIYELFAAIDGKTEGVTVDDDNRISRSEWDASLQLVQSASSTWAPFVALQSAKKGSFDQIDTNGGGFIVLTEFCEW